MPLKFYLLKNHLELEAQQGVENDCNQHIILDEGGFQGSQTFDFRNNHEKLIMRAIRHQKSIIGEIKWNHKLGFISDRNDSPSPH